MDPTAAPPLPERRLIAPWWHTITILLVYLAPSISMVIAKHATPAAQSAPWASAAHNAMLRNYAISVALEWGMAYWAWVGVHWRG